MLSSLLFSFCIGTNITVSSWMLVFRVGETGSKNYTGWVSPDDGLPYLGLVFVTANLPCISLVNSKRKANTNWNTTIYKFAKWKKSFLYHYMVFLAEQLKIAACHLHTLPSYWCCYLKYLRVFQICPEFSNAFSLSAPFHWSAWLTIFEPPYFVSAHNVWHQCDKNLLHLIK